MMTPKKEAMNGSIQTLIKSSPIAAALLIMYYIGNVQWGATIKEMGAQQIMFNQNLTQTVRDMNTAQLNFNEKMSQNFREISSQQLIYNQKIAEAIDKINIAIIEMHSHLEHIKPASPTEGK